MAAPPFALATTLPEDTDIVSQFPQNERTNRDIIQSWLLVNHDVNGNHLIATFPWQSTTPATPAASLTQVYASATGRLQIVYPDGSIGFVGNPPGSVIHFAGSITPVGYLISDGSAVSRSTYADLFAVIGIAYGSGDGTSTFNLPDIKGRVIAGEDATSSRLSTTYFGATPTLAAVGGLESELLTLAQLPGGITSFSGSLLLNSQVNVIGLNVAAGSTNVLVPSSQAGSTPYASQASGTVTSNNTNGASHPNVQPTIIQRVLIKV